MKYVRAACVGAILIAIGVVVADNTELRWQLDHTARMIASSNQLACSVK